MNVLAWALLVPRNAAIGVLLMYQRLISPLYGDVCRYHPSCSHYAVGSIARFGLFGGIVLTVRRLFRCHPWAAGGFDEVPLRKRQWTHVTRWGFVAPGVDTEGKA